MRRELTVFVGPQFRQSARGTVRRAPWLVWPVAACGLVSAWATWAWGQAARPTGEGDAAAPAPHAGVPLTEIPRWAPPGAGTADTAPDDATAARAEAARELLSQGQFARAVMELDAALKGCRQPGHDLLILLAKAKRGLGRDGEARLAAEAAVRQQPDSIEGHLLLGRLHRAAGRPELALAHLRTATLAGGDGQADPVLVTLAWYELGEVLAAAGYARAAAEALARFDEVVQAGSEELRADAEVAEILQAHPYGLIERQLELLRPVGPPAERVALAEAALKRRAGEPYFQKLYVGALIEAGRAAEAFDYCRRQLAAPATTEAATTNPDVILALALETATAAGRLEEWVVELAGEVEAGRGLEQARRVARRLEDQNASQAARLWQALATAEPESVDVQWALASALRAGGDWTAALNALIRLVRAGGDEADILSERLAAWMRGIEATEEFLRCVRDLAERPDSDYATFTVLATTAAAAGQTELAKGLFERALAARPDFPLARLGRGRMWLAASRWEAARSEAEAILAGHAHMAAAHYLAAQAHAALDEHDAAEAAYRRAVEECPADPTYALALGRQYRRTGNLLSAQRYFQEAWSLAPGLGEAVEELIDCYLEGGKAEIARRTLQQAEGLDLPADTLRRIRTVLRFADAPMQAEHLAELSRQWAEHPDDVVTGLRLAVGLFMNQRPDEALPIAERVWNMAPDDERAVYLLVQIHLRRLEGPQALRLLEPLVARHPRRPQALRLLAEAHLAEFRIPEARQTYDRLLELPIPPEQRNAARLNLLATFLELGDYEAAVQRVDAWLAAEPDSDAWARAKLRVLLAAQRASEAVAWATLRLEPATQRFDELRRRAQALAERLRAAPDDADAAAQMKNLERELAGVVAALFDRRAEWVQTCLDAERYGTAERQIRLWLAEQPEQFQLQEWLVQALLGAEQAGAALAASEKLVPTSAAETLSALVWRARCRAATGNLDAALDDLKALLGEGFVRESPLAQDQLRQEMIGLLADARQTERAIDLCRQWLREMPESDRLARLSTLRLLHHVLGTANRLGEQVEVMERLLEFQPHDPGVNNDLAYTWADHGEHLDRALKMVRLAVAAEPLNGAYLDSLGWVYYKMGRFDDARTYLSRATQLRSGQDAVVQDHLGDAEYRRGDLAAARRQWQKALTLLEAPETAAGSAALSAGLRAKLAALDRSEQPAVAPTGPEQAATRPSSKETR